MSTFRRMNGSLITNELSPPNPRCCNGQELCPRCVSQLMTNGDPDDDDEADIRDMHPTGFGYDEIFPSDGEDDLDMAPYGDEAPAAHDEPLGNQRTLTLANYQPRTLTNNATDDPGDAWLEAMKRIR